MTKRAERSLRAFIEGAWPVLEPQTRFVPNWHIDLIAEYLEAVTAGEIGHLLINRPGIRSDGDVGFNSPATKM